MTSHRLAGPRAAVAGHNGDPHTHLMDEEVEAQRACLTCPGLPPEAVRVGI